MNQINHEGLEVHEGKYADLRVLCVLRGENDLFSNDANGNRLNLTENKDSNEEIQTIYRILENSNRLTKVADTEYQYDHNGNIINDGEHSYTYDARNRLVSIDNGTTASYLYNANNMRVMKTVQQPDPLSPQVVRYGWDNDRIFAEYDASGNPVQETVYFGSTPIALVKDGNIYRIFADQIDTPRVITDNTNTTLWAWDSKPFGESQPDEDMDNDGTKLSYNLRFPGQYYDQETGTHYNFNRDYDPVTGRYVQSDPIGLDGGMNLFNYSSANPMANIDPNGLRAKVIRKGNDLTVQMRISYIGKYAAQGPVFNAGIKSIWEGTYGSWTLTVDLSQGPWNTIKVINKWYDTCATNRKNLPVSFVLGVGAHYGVWNLADTYAGKCTSTRGQLAAHEAGHLMGLDDKYTEGVGIAWRGWENNIMGDSTQPAELRNLGEMVHFHKL